MCHALIEEFGQSFRNYVRPDGDDREIMLSGMLEVDHSRITLLEPHDFAALLTCTAHVDPKCLAAKKAEAAFAEEQVVDEGILPTSINHPAENAKLGTIIAELDRTEKGRKFLQTVVICLAAAHAIPGLRKRLWKP